jgi:hypothetical protein
MTRDKLIRNTLPKHSEIESRLEAILNSASAGDLAKKQLADELHDAWTNDRPHNEYLTGNLLFTLDALLRDIFSNAEILREQLEVK